MNASMLKPALLAAVTAIASLPAAAVETACVANGGTNCPAQIPDFPLAALTSTLTVPQLTCPGGVLPSGVAVRLNLAHDWTGDLNISLTNPNSTTATIVAANPLTNDGTDLVATYTNTTLLGAGTGAWTLTVLDTANGNIGVLNDWGIDAVCRAPADVPALSPAPMTGMALLLAVLGMFSLRRYLRR